VGRINFVSRQQRIFVVDLVAEHKPISLLFIAFGNLDNKYL
jgi:hypothetical protein